MTSTRPLRQTGTDLERTLLSAGAAERPDAASVRTAAKILGIVPRAALVAATLGVALRATRWSSVAGWSCVPLVGVLGVALVAPLATRATVTTPSAGADGSRAHGSPEPRVPELQTAAAGVPAAAERTAVPAMLRPATAAIRASTRRAAPAASAPADSLREQAEVLDGARERLALGEPNGALSRLDEYDRRFAGGPLHEEAQLLRIEAEALAGDRAAASSLAKRFLRTYPASVHFDRVAAIVQSMAP